MGRQTPPLPGVSNVSRLRRIVGVGVANIVALYLVFVPPQDVNSYMQELGSASPRGTRRMIVHEPPPPAPGVDYTRLPSARGKKDMVMVMSAMAGRVCSLLPAPLLCHQTFSCSIS